MDDLIESFSAIEGKLRDLFNRVNQLEAAPLITSSSGGGAPVDAQYLTLAFNAVLTNERRLDFSARFATVDGGAGGDYDVDLAASGVAPGAYGSATQVAQVTVDAYGRVTNAANVAIAGVPPLAHPLLGNTYHNDVATDAPTRGSLIVGNSTPLWDELVIGAAGTVLRSDGNDPNWTTLSAAGIAPSNATYIVVSLTAALTNERNLNIGNGLTATDNGANNSYDVVLGTPTTLTSTTINLSGVGTHTHAITNSSDGTANPLTITSFDINGALTASDYFTNDGGTFGIPGNELLTVNAAGTFGFSGISGVTVENGDWIGRSAAVSILFNDAATPAIDVSGTIGFDQYLYHNGDTDTYINFQTDQITIVAGSATMIDIVEAATDEIHLIPVGGNIGFLTATPSLSPSALAAMDYVFQLGNNTLKPELRLAGPNNADVSSKIVFDNSSSGDGYSIFFNSNTGSTYGPDGLVFYDENGSALNWKFDRDGGYAGFKIEEPGAAVDISCGDICIIVGADSAATTRTDATTKVGRIGAAHYTIAEEPFCVSFAYSDSDENRLYLGGGTGSFNASTSILFYTASNATTLTGTLRAYIDDAGNFGIGNNTTLAEMLHVYATTGAVRGEFETGDASSAVVKITNTAGSWGVVTASGKFSIYDYTALTNRFYIDTDGDIGNVATPLAELHIDQASSTAAQPVLMLDQGDVSEQCILFTSDSTDRDIYLYTIDVTGTPYMLWDESDDLLRFSKSYRAADLFVDDGGQIGASYTGATSPYFQIDITNNYIIMGDSSGRFSVGAIAAPTAMIDVQQSSLTGAIPVLQLRQNDLSEEFINFITTVGAGNPIDTAAIGTYYGKARVAVNGTFKYIALYNS